MKKNLHKLILIIFPLLVIIWGIYNLLFFDPFYSRSSDPEYPYLINGLNCALGNFDRIGLVDHPGTPFHLYIGIIILLTHLLSGESGIAADVLSRPEFYLNSISLSLFLIQGILVYIIGLIGVKRKISLWQVLILQSGFVLHNLLMWLFCRVSPDRFFMITGLIFTAVFLYHGYNNHSMRKFSVWSGVVMALGVATKFNYFPLLILPLLITGINRNSLIYAGSVILSFFIFILPIIDKLGDYQKFLSDIFHHDGLYGSGKSQILNIPGITANILEIFRLNPELLLMMVTLTLLVLINIFSRIKGREKYVFLFGGFLIIIAMQIVMVSKHFKNYYLVPVFMYYGIILFFISLFLAGIIRNKRHLIIAGSILPVLFVMNTLVRVKQENILIKGLIQQREKIREFADSNIQKTDFWFIEPTWESGPHIENAIVYGLSYCRHREKYLPQLIAIHPNIITYEGENNQVRLWRGIPVNLDSVVATGRNINIYSTPGRHASDLLNMIQNVAIRNNLKMVTDTLFSHPSANSEIIQIKASNTKSEWRTVDHTGYGRQSRIDRYIQTIKESPEWLEKVKEKAILKNIPLDSMIFLDAKWMVENE